MSKGRNDFWHFERAGWQKAATHYESSWSGLTTRFVPPLLQAVGVAPGVRFLDVACGPGYGCEAAAELGAAVVGVDLCVKMIQQARERNPDREFHQGDAQELPFSSERFDVVVSNFGFPHIAAPEIAFAESRRVLREGGRFGFTVWAEPHQNPGLALMHSAVEAHADLSVELPRGPSPFRFADVEEVRRTLADAGYEPSSVTSTLVDVEWRVPSASHFFEAERRGGVRTAALLAAQTEECLAAIRVASERAFARFATDEGYAIPMAAHVITTRC